MRIYYGKGQKGEIYLVGGKLNTVVRHNMDRVTLTHKYTLKKLYDTTSCNIGHKFNLAPFRKVVDENNSVFPVHGLEGTHDVYRYFLPPSFRWQSRGQWCLVRPVGFVTRSTQVAISDQVLNLFVESGPPVVLTSLRFTRVMPKFPLWAC